MHESSLKGGLAMELSTIWWVLAGVTVAAELLIGSFYLLMLSLGMAAGAIAAQVGSPLTVQLLVAAGVGGAAVLLWRRMKQGRGAERAVDAYSRVASDASTTPIVPSNMSKVSALIASAMKMVQVGK